MTQVKRRREWPPDMKASIEWAAKTLAAEHVAQQAQERRTAWRIAGDSVPKQRRAWLAYDAAARDSVLCPDDSAVQAARLAAHEIDTLDKRAEFGLRGGDITETLRRDVVAIRRARYSRCTG